MQEALACPNVFAIQYRILSCRWLHQVLGAAYPWIARRLLTDPSPDLRVALRQLLYASEEEGGIFRFDRLESLLLEVRA